MMIVWKPQTRKIILLVLKIFFVWLMLQFFLQTFVTFELWWNNIIWKIIWAWKEILIVMWAGLVIYVFAKNINCKNIQWLKSDIINRRYQLKLNQMPILKFIIVFLLTALVTLIISLLINKVWISNYILSAKYNLIGFFIFILSFIIARLFLNVEDLKIVNRYNKLFKVALVGAFFWWIMVWLMPNFLKFFGYNWLNYEWTIWEAPPAAYYTMINQWAVRNQFLFERPISFGFFLVALWPVFFMGVLKWKWKKQVWWWSIFYGIIVLSTLSRAAIWVWLLITMIMILLINFDKIKKIFWKLILPLLILIGVWGIFFYQNSGDRIHSNVWHIQLPLEWINIISDNSIFGRWAWYAWPASHQVCYNNLEDQRCEKIKEINDKYEITTIGFNPENQYIQIWIEYGLFGFLWRMIMFVWLNIIGYKVWMEQRSKKFSKNIRANGRIIIWLSLWILGLAIEGIVLHSFVDRMIVYPFMALFGLAYALYYKQTHERNIN